jgi:hypothetical protein
VEILDTGSSKKLVYIKATEKEAFKKLSQIRDPDTVYSKQGKAVGHHWLLAPETIAKKKMRGK